MGKKLDRKVQKLRVRAKVRRQSLKNNPPARGLKLNLADANRPLLDKLLAGLQV